MKAVFGLITGLILSLILAAFAGENPIHILTILGKSAFGSPYDLGLTLFYTTSLIFTGLSVCIAFHAGLFNIGAEGQLNIGAFTMAATGILFPFLPPIIAPIVAILFGVAAAAAWGWIPGYLKAKRGSHEVIITMMMNFIASGIVSFFIVGKLKNPNSQNPETAEMASQFILKSVNSESPFNFSFYLAIILAVVIWIFLYRTIWGFELRATGQNEEASQVSGINTQLYKILSLTLAGAFAGLVGLNEVIAFSGKFRLGFSADFGFIGIAVALLARNNPLGILLTAFLFGALQKGSTDLDFETQKITKDFTKIIQAIIILSVAASVTLTNRDLKKFMQKIRGKMWNQQK